MLESFRPNKIFKNFVIIVHSFHRNVTLSPQSFHERKKVHYGLAEDVKFHMRQLKSITGPEFYILLLMFLYKKYKAYVVKKI